MVRFVVKDGLGTPVEGATFNLEIAFPTLIISRTGLTGVDGTVEIGYKINTNKTGTGTTTVTVAVSKDGYLDGTGTIGLEIQ